MDVTWGQTFSLPQPGDQSFGLPFCTIVGMTPTTIPKEVELLREDGKTSADTREYTHFNLLGRDEMDDLTAALNLRVQELGETHDLIVIGEGPSLETSQHIAIFMAPKSFHAH